MKKLVILKIKMLLKYFGINISKSGNKIFSIEPNTYFYKNRRNIKDNNILSRVNIKFENEIIPFYYREYSKGDKGVISQIFENLDYDISNWEQGKKLNSYYKNHSGDKSFLIIDAGANIGSSAVYFSYIYRNSFIFSIEPNYLNWSILEKNTKNIKTSVSIQK